MNKKNPGFNKTRADMVETEDGRGRKRRMNAGQAPSTKRQRLSKAMCTVSDLPLAIREEGVMTTDCCSTLVHVSCSPELEQCPDFSSD